MFFLLLVLFTHRRYDWQTDDGVALIHRLMLRFYGLGCGLGCAE